MMNIQHIFLNSPAQRRKDKII